MMPRRLALSLALLLTPAAAQEANLALSSAPQPGAASQLVLAQEVYREAGRTGDPVLLLTAIRLARGVTLRMAPAWERSTAGDADPPTDALVTTPMTPWDPSALAVLQALVMDDPDLQDLVYDLDAQLPPGRQPVATVATAGLSGGAEDAWRLPLSGSVPAEIAVIGDGGTRLSLTVTDEGGAVVCAVPATTSPGLCRFTPARNGFFAVRIRNTGADWSSYRLVGN